MFANRLFRTTSFRLILIASVVFSVAVLFLLYFVISVTTTILTRQNDLAVQSEIKEIFNDAHDNNLSAVTATVTRMSATSPQYFYVLQNRSGAYIAGNLPAMVPITGAYDWEGKPLNSKEQIHLRGSGMLIFDDVYLFVAVRAYKSAKMYGPVMRSFLWLMGPTFLAVLFGGLFVSNRMLARVEAISRTSREIVSGDLQRRMPVSQSNDEFDHLAVSVNVMLDQIQDLMEGLRQVSNDVAHDLRTPLSRLRQRLELSHDKATTEEELREALAQSMNQVDTILAIFSSLLRIAQIESGLRKSHFKKLDLATVLYAVSDLYKPVFEEKMQTLIVDITDGLAMSGDKELLTQLFINIVDNATNHTPSKSEILIKAFTESGEDIVVELSDNGFGIPETQRQKVLQRFYRMEQSRSTPGHGLGLSLAKAIVDQHDGKIELLDKCPGLLIKIKFKLCPSHLP